MFIFVLCNFLHNPRIDYENELRSMLGGNNLKYLSIRRKLVALTFTALFTALSMTACSSTSAPTNEVTKEAGVFTKDITVCFTNESNEEVDLQWVSGISSNDGSGTLATDESFCGEGPDPRILATFSDGFATYLDAYNPVVGEPSLTITSTSSKRVLDCSPGQDGCHQTTEAEVYFVSTFGQGETLRAKSGAHPSTISRQADSDWINFVVTFTN